MVTRHSRGRLESVIGRNELVATRECATIYPPDTPNVIMSGPARASA
jgi:hypothetical protein